MHYYLGIDAGGTKTEFALSDARGRILSSTLLSGLRMLERSEDELKAALADGVERTLQSANVAKGDVAAACLGISGYGESAEGDARAERVLRGVLPNAATVCANDSCVAWAGALGMQPGINVISGTGAIAYGEDGQGRSARASGWGAMFDEGSCRWIGERMIQAYTRQADGRTTRTELYEKVRAHEQIESDDAFIERLNHGYFNDAAHVASLQRVCLELWNMGDPDATGIYDEAGYELALAASAVAKALSLPEGWRASCTGGLFQAGDAILVPFGRQICRLGGIPTRPLAGPIDGAIKLAMRAKEDRA